MTCIELDDLIEPLAAGDVEPSAEVRAHLAECPSCAASLALATRINRVLIAQVAPVPRPDFTAALVTRMRRERWRSEQMLDLTFNFAVGLVAVIAIVGLWVAFSSTGLGAVGLAALNTLGRAVSESALQAAPQARIYALTTIGLVTGLGVWWWAERGLGV
jgi:predicted anti-sigma-YlaC factor YlaD